jgi:type I restriction enzyme S subunit
MEKTETIEMEQPEIKIREGYKKTQIGWIPNDWEITKLRDVAFVQTGVQKGASINGDKIKLPYIRVANVQDGHLDLSEIKEIEVAKNRVDRFFLRRGDVLMTEGGDFDKLGRGAIWNNQIPNCLHQNHVFAVRTDNNKLLPYFLNSYSSSSNGKLYFKRCSKQTTNLASINSTQLKDFPIPLPSLSEQKKITRILEVWDAAVEEQKKLIELYKVRKKGLEQQLLSGVKRLGDFNDSWIERKASHIFTSRNEKVIKNGEIPLYSLTIEDGVTAKTDRYEREFLVKDKNKKYKKVYPNDIVFNPSNLRWGAIAIHKGNTPVLLSPIYEVLEINSGFDAQFVSYLVSSTRQILYFATLTEGTLVERMAVKVGAFLNCKYNVPSLKEQRAIAKVLTAADGEIKAQEIYLKKLQEQKKGLMQKLLTGEIRVNVN